MNNSPKKDSKKFDFIKMKDGDVDGFLRDILADKIANATSPEEAADISFDFIAGINAARRLMEGKPFTMEDDDVNDLQRDILANEIENAASPEKAADIAFGFIAGINAARRLMEGKPFIMSQLIHKKGYKKTNSKDKKEGPSN